MMIIYNKCIFKFIFYIFFFEFKLFNIFQKFNINNIYCLLIYFRIKDDYDFIIL